MIEWWEIAIFLALLALGLWCLNKAVEAEAERVGRVIADLLKDRERPPEKGEST